MFTKRTLCALLCAMVLVTAVVPAFADGGRPVNHSASYNETLSSIGVQAFYSCSFSGKYATGGITLSYLSDPSNHLPANDYVTYVSYTLHDIGNGTTSYTPGALLWGHMTYSETIHTSNNLAIKDAQYEFCVNGSNEHTINLSL